MGCNTDFRGFGKKKSNLVRLENFEFVGTKVYVFTHDGPTLKIPSLYKYFIIFSRKTSLLEKKRGFVTFFNFSCSTSYRNM